MLVSENTKLDSSRWLTEAERSAEGFGDAAACGRCLGRRERGFSYSCRCVLCLEVPVKAIP
jgi:hypothetical protein